MRPYKLHLNVKSKKYRTNKEYVDILKLVVAEIDELPKVEIGDPDEL